jgi:acyl carrier protein
VDADASVREFIRGAVREIDLAGKIAWDSFRDDMPLTSLGLDSLDLFSVYLAIEHEFGIKILDADVDALRSVDDLAGYVQRAVASRQS